MDIGSMESRGEQLAPRLVKIIIKLASGQKFTTAKLAEEFGVDQRTIRRDLNEHLSNYVECDLNNNYYITPSLSGKLTTSDCRGLANNAGIGGLYPELTNRFIKELLDQSSETVYDVEGYNYENNQEYRSLFQKLSSAIEEQQIIKFIYKENNYSDIHHFQIKKANGIWYLMAVDGGKIKSFTISKINWLIIHQDSYQKDKTINKEIEEQNCA